MTRPVSAAERILVVDDEPKIVEILDAYLKREGYEVCVAATAAEALDCARSLSPSLMILDLNLPDGNGLDVFRAVSSIRKIPTIILTARADEVEKVVGLELGADDYVTKPFSPREVVARVRAVMRRSTSAERERETTEVLRIGVLEIDREAHEVHVNGRIADLTPTEFRVLLALAEHAGQVLTRGQLLDRLHDDGSIFERTLDRHINNLRKKIEPDPEEPTYVITVFGVGYKLVK